METGEKLQAIYAELPKIDCKRKCQGACGPLLIPRVENVQIEKAGAIFDLSSIKDVELSEKWAWMDRTKLVATRPIPGSLDCSMLYPSGKCRVYAIRPLVCRVWGMIDEPEMRCPFGCVPDRWLTGKEVRSLFERVLGIE
jgi:Fe-S-cluster containining protein